MRLPRLSPRIMIGAIVPVALWFASFQLQRGGLLRLALYLLVIVAAGFAAIRSTGVWRAFWGVFLVVYSLHIVCFLFTAGGDWAPPFRWTFELALILSFNFPWNFSWPTTSESIFMIVMVGVSTVAGLLSMALYRLEDKQH